jgi:hypothetical protein
MVLALLREFGTPAEIAARYRPPGVVVIPPGDARTFALVAVAGVALQWALTLPQVFSGQQALVAWWLGMGLGAFWWPGFMVMFALLGAWLRHMGWFKPAWRPRLVDPERVNRSALAFGLAWFAIGSTLVASLPWLAPRMPGVLPQVFAFDPEFLRSRAWVVLPLWLGSFAILLAALRKGRWTPLLHRLEIASSLAFIALLGWWLAAGDMFRAPATNEGARAAIALVILIIVIGLVASLYRRRTRITPPKPGAPKPGTANHAIG